MICDECGVGWVGDVVDVCDVDVVVGELCDDCVVECIVVDVVCICNVCVELGGLVGEDCWCVVWEWFGE